MDLTLDRVGVTLSGRSVLNDVTLGLKPGRITAILGPNGAGKSTLVKVAAGLVSLAGGAVRMGERSIGAIPPRERARMIGYLPQDAVVHWNMPVHEVVALGRLPHRNPHAAPSAGDRAAIDAALAATETAHLGERPVAELSGGERGRVLLARVLAGEPRWLLADEPLAALDPAHQIDLLDRLRDVAAGGAGVAIVLHDLVQAQRVADDVLIVAEGRIVAFGPVDEVMTDDMLARVFGVRVVPITDGGRRLLIPVGRASP